MRTVPGHIPCPDYAESGIAESERDAKRAGVIRQLSDDEIRGMRKACKVRRQDWGHMMVTWLMLIFVVACLFVCLFVVARA